MEADGTPALRLKAGRTSTQLSEACDDACEDTLRESFGDEGEDESSAATYAGAVGRNPGDELHGSESRLPGRAAPTGGFAMPGMREAGLHGQMSRGRQGEGVRATDRCRRLPGGSGQDSRRQRAPRDHRPCLPAGGSLRGWMPDG